MLNKKNFIALMIATLGGGISLVLAGSDFAGSHIGFLFFGLCIGIAVGILKTSFKRGILAIIICMLMSIVAMFAAFITVLIINPQSDILKAVVSGLIMGTILGGTIGIVAGYGGPGYRIILDSLESIIGGVLGGTAGMVIVLLGYSSHNNLIFTFSGFIGGIIFALFLIAGLEIAERNKK